MKCANFVCLNDASGRIGTRGKFCRKCLASSSPFVFVCEICDNTFVKDNKGIPSRLPLYCSSKCRIRGKYLKHGQAWAKKHYKKKPSKLERHYAMLKPLLLIRQIEPCVIKSFK